MILAMFIALAITLLMGIPVGFSIGISVATSLLVDGGTPVVIMVQKMIDGVNSFTLMALPLFVLSGAIMSYGSTPRILRMANMLLRKKQWGLGNAAVISCAAFGTISGSGVATTAAIGGVMGPEMVKKGYDKGYTASLLGAAGVLGIVIPPSITFVVYAQCANVSISDMFLAGFIPGIMAALFLCIFNKIMVKKHNWGQQASDNDLDYDNMTAAEKRKIVLDAIPPMFMPVIILGGVMSGIFTPTEAASVASVYALVLAGLVYKELSLKDLVNVFVDSAVSSATILFIISAATPFGWILTAQNVATSMGNWLMAFSGNIIVVYGIILLLLVLLGTFMETLAIVLLTTPIFLPILMQLGVDPVAYGITLTLALCVGSVTPPLAVTLFTACKILKIRVEETIPVVFWVCGILLFASIVTAVIPDISLFLPHVAKMVGAG